MESLELQPSIIKMLPGTYVYVLGSAGIELTFTKIWLGWLKQPIKWDILYHVNVI